MVTIEIKKSSKLTNSSLSGYVSFKFDLNILNVIKELPFRYYDKNTVTWEIPADKIPYIVSNLKEYEIDIKGDIEAYDKLFSEQKTVELLENFKFKTEPFSHQLDGIKYGLQYDRWFLGDEQGLGKTKQVIDIAVARKLKYGYKHCLIVCGVNTLKWNWVNEIHTHSTEGAYILGQKISKNKIKIGSTKDKVNDLTRLLSDSLTVPYFIITNVESFRDETFAKTVQELCKKGIINMCAADEMHKMKNPTSQQTKGFLKCLPDCRIGMTGTPLMNSPMDLYVILKWLGYENHAFYSFKNHYCVMGGYGGYEIVGYRNLDQLSKQVNEIMLRRLKDDVLDLPDKTYVDEYVEMSTKQALLYRDVEAGIKSAIATGDIDITNPLSILIRLRQCTGYTGILTDDFYESAKLDRMCDIVEESVSNNKKVIIFSNWTQMTDAIYDKLAGGKYGVSVITGNTPDNDRQNIVDLFQNSPDCNVLVGTIGAMGTGLTLTSATTVIFLDHPWSRALYDQAVDRAHRIGQKENITVYNMLTKDTIDERIWSIVNKKGAMSDAIIDGKVVGNKTELLNYLLS